MKQCAKCQLAFDSLNAQGLCENCAPAQQQQPNQDSETAALRRQLAESDQRFRQLQSNIQQPQQPDPAQQRQELNRQAWSDPVSFVQNAAATIAAQTVAQAQAADHETMVSVAKREARENLPEDQRAYFDKYQAEIIQAMTSQAPQFHRNANVWRNIATTVIGSHIREILHEERERAQTESGQQRPPAVRTSDGPGAPSTRPAPSTRAPQAELTDEAKRIARKLDISDDQMRQGIKDFENQGDSDDVSKPSSWDRVMSFNKRTGQVGARNKRLEDSRRAVNA